MKRVLWIVALLALVLAGCGGAADDEGDSGESGEAVAGERPRLRREDDQARGADAADRPGGGDRQAADGRQRGLLRLRQLAGRHRRQVQGRAGPGGHAVLAAGHRPAVQQDQEQRRGVHAGARHRADARHPAAARAGQHHRGARLARRLLGARAEPAAGRRALPGAGDQRARLLHQSGRRQGQEHLLVHPGRRVRRGRPVGRRLRGRAARLQGRRHAEVQGRRQGRDRPGAAAPGLQVRRGLPRRHADRRRHDLGHGRQARLRAALDRPVADVDRRAGRLAAGRVPPADDVDRRRGHRVGRRPACPA